MTELTDKQKAELQAMDNAATEAETELSELFTSSQLEPGVNAIEDWMYHWVPKAGYKRLGRILFINAKERQKEGKHE